MNIGIILTIIGIIVSILLAVLIPLVVFIYNGRRKLKKYYEVIWKKLSSLKPIEVLRERPFETYYYQRPEDDLIAKSLNNRKNVLIIGPPLSGKSRAAYQALTNLNKPHAVTIPRSTDIDLETFSLPKRLKFWRPRTVLVDDLQRFVEQQNFEELFRLAMQNNVVILATCRSEMEHTKVKNKMLDKNIDLATIFGENVIELERVSEDVGQQIAREAGITWDNVRFDGTVGSIFMDLAEMEKRFNNCDDVEKTILRAIRSLYICGIYQAHQVFPLDWVKTAARREGLEGKDFEWTGRLESLKGKEFITLGADKVYAEEAYLEYVVKPKGEKSDLAVFEEMLATFSGVPKALLRLGNRAYEVGTIKLEKAEYMKTAIKAYEEALKVYTLERFPMDYAMTQNNLGNAYRTLSEVEAKAENCKQAIKAYEEALKVYTKEEFPEIHQEVEHNLRVLLDFYGVDKS